MKLLRVIAVVALVSIAPAWAGACRSGLPLGRIDRIEPPDAQPAPVHVGADNRRSIAQPFDWLCPGDAIEITGSATVVASFARGEQRRFGAGRNSVDAGASTRGAAPGLLDFLNDVFGGLQGPRKPIAVFNETRAPGQKKPELSVDPLLPAGAQLVPATYHTVVLLWRGGPGIVSVAAAGKATRVNSGRRAYTLLDLPDGNAPIKLALLDQTIEWNVTRGGAAPAADSATRLQDALQILRAGPDNRRLFALSEIATLSATGNYVAEQLWAAARSGELSEVLRKR